MLAIVVVNNIFYRCSCLSLLNRFRKRKLNNLYTYCFKRVQIPTTYNNFFVRYLLILITVILIMYSHQVYRTVVVYLPNNCLLP